MVTHTPYTPTHHRSITIPSPNKRKGRARVFDPSIQTVEESKPDPGWLKVNRRTGPGNREQGSKACEKGCKEIRHTIGGPKDGQEGG